MTINTGILSEIIIFIQREPNLTSSKTGICVKDDEDGSKPVCIMHISNYVRMKIMVLYRWTMLYGENSRNWRCFVTGKVLQIVMR